MNRARTVAVLLLVVGAVAMLAGGLGLLALSLDGGDAPETGGGGTSAGEAVGALHDRGITGENVTVGILDVTGFEPDRPPLENRVVEHEQFGNGTSAVARDPAHGTKAATTVTRVAPDAELYLGTFETPAEYEAALSWLVEHDVDVVVAPVAYAGTPGDGTSRMARATTNATDRGVLVVAPSGNTGQGHWLGEYTPTEDGVHVFESATLDEIAGPAGRAEFWLVTDGAAGEYSLELHELGDGPGTDLVAKSVPYGPGSAASQRLTVRLEDGRYGLVVRGPAAETGDTIRIASATHSFARGRPARSVTAPAVAPGALSVGAFDPVTNRTEPYSSRGPTRDGRLGVHVVAPSALSLPEETFEGTSASASFVGGVAALVLDAEPALDAGTLHGILTATAEPIDGVNAESGHGRVAPAAAVAEVTEPADEDDPS